MVFLFFIVSASACFIRSPIRLRIIIFLLPFPTVVDTALTLSFVSVHLAHLDRFLLTNYARSRPLTPVFNRNFLKSVLPLYSWLSLIQKPQCSGFFVSHHPLLLSRHKQSLFIFPSPTFLHRVSSFNHAYITPLIISNWLLSVFSLVMLFSRRVWLLSLAFRFRPKSLISVVTRHNGVTIVVLDVLLVNLSFFFFFLPSTNRHFVAFRKHMHSFRGWFSPF